MLNQLFKSSKIETRLLQSVLLATAAIFGTAIFDANAQGRPSTKSYTCEELKDDIRDNGDAIMSHKSSGLFRRFVHSIDECDEGKIIQRFSVPSASGRCTLKICVAGDDD